MREESDGYVLKYYPVDFINKAIEKLNEIYPEWRQKYITRLADDDDYVEDVDR